MNIPAKEEINIYNSPDEASACEHFLGKNLDEAEMMFRENSLYYLEDLMWMGPVAFRFYLEALINYLKSDDSGGDADVINGIYGLLQFRMNEDEFNLPVERARLMTDYILDSYEKFEVNEAIYGNLLGKFKEIHGRLNDEKPPPPDEL